MMTTRCRMRQSLALALIAGLFVSVGATSVAAGPRGFALSSNSLVSFDTTNPTVVSAATAIVGLTVGDTLVAIDFRPQNGFLYGLGFNSVAGTVQLYSISYRTGVATPVGTAGTYVDGVGSPVAIAGTAFGFDFNPAVDRIRVVSNSGQNFRMNPNTGAFIDGDLGGAAGSVTGLNMDGPINGATVDAAAYTNNQPNTTVTTLYTLSAVTNALYIQNVPNSGTQTLAKTVMFNGNPLDFTSATGFDIAPGVNAPASNAVAPGTGYAILSVLGTEALYAIDLTTGAATRPGAIGLGNFPIQGLAVQGEAVTGGLPAITLAAGTNLVRFNTAVLGTTTTVAVSGLLAGEILAGVDYRPQTGQLFALGVNTTNGTGSASLYRVDPQTGAATLVGAANSIANGAGTPISLASATTFGFDFNPTVDRIRVVTNTGVNFRVNPNDGSLTGTDTPINGGTTTVTGAAYTNSFGQSVGLNPTTLYTLDPSTNTLFIQNPPNLGTETLGLPVTIGGAPLDFSADTGFDIPANIRVATSNVAASGQAYAALIVGGVSRLYTIELSTGAATLLGTIIGSPTSGLALADGPLPATTTTLTTSGNPGVVNQPLTLTATISPANATGTVSFTSLVFIPGGTCNAQPIIAGVATCTFSPSTAGSGTVTAAYSGDATHQPSTSPLLSQTVVQVVTTTALVVDPTLPDFGQAVTFTATVTPSAATGNVTFLVDGNSVGTAALSGGHATLTTSTLAIGPHQVTAVYGGVGFTYTGSTSAAVPMTVGEGLGFTQYFAEGATGFFQTDLGILNTSKTNTANVRVKLLTEIGTPIVQLFTLPPLARRTIDVNTTLGNVQGVSTRIDADQPVAATRQMTWGNPVYGSTLESGIPSKASTWYFAEGATSAFSLFYLVENPNDVPASVTLTHLLEGGAPPVVEPETVPAQTRRTFFINAIQGLEAATMSTVVTSDVPIVTERAMYLNSTARQWEGGTAGRGATALSTAWSFAEGATGFFHTYLLFGNPSTTDATVTVRYLLPNGSTIQKPHQVNGKSRLSIDVAAEDAQLLATSVGISVSSTVPIVAERAMWWGTPWNEGSATVGSTETGSVWAIGEGAEGGPNAESTFVLVSNASANPGNVRFTVVYDDGSRQQKDYPLLANARSTVRIGDDFFTAVGKRFSVLVESLTAGMPITVECARYQSPISFADGGGVALATKVQ